MKGIVGSPGGLPLLREGLQLVVVGRQVFDLLHAHVLGGRSAVAAVLGDVRQQCGPVKVKIIIGLTAFPYYQKNLHELILEL